MSGWLKAGLIGVAILIVLNLIGLIPFLACITAPLSWITYVVVGVLAASYMAPRREAGKAAGQGALAALLAGFGGGIVSAIIGAIRAATGGVTQYGEMMSQIPPDVIRELRNAGISPDMVAGVGGIGGAIVCGSMCCLVGVFVAAALGAIGGAIYAAVKPE